MRTSLRVGARFFHQATSQESAHHAVNIDSPDCRDTTATDRLSVCHYSQGLQCGLGEPSLLAIQHVLVDNMCEIIAGVIAPATTDLTQLKATPLLVVLSSETNKCSSNFWDRITNSGGQGCFIHRLVSDHQQCLWWLLPFCLIDSALALDAQP